MLIYMFFLNIFAYKRKRTYLCKNLIVNLFGKNKTMLLT